MLSIHHFIVAITLCLITFGILSAAELIFVEPGVLVDGTYGPRFVINEKDPIIHDKQGAIKRLETAFVDMIIMAGVACVTFRQHEEVYQRYFGEPNNNPDLVRSIICAIGGYPPSTMTARQIFMQPMVNPKFQKLIVTAGQAYAKQLGSKAPTEQDDYVFAATTYQDLTQYGIGQDDEAALTYIYPRAFDYPSLSDIWYQRGLKGLGAKDSGLMTSLGAHLLHEVLHWRYLVRDGWNQTPFDADIKHKVYVRDEHGNEREEERDYIDDYDRDQYEDKNTEPLDGYGPKNAASLVINQEKDSFRNADNYRWYIVSKFWQGSFGYEFDAQDDESKGDQMIPHGAKGQVPYPGERIPLRP